MNQMPPDDSNKQTDSTRTILAILICVALYAGYTEYLKRKYPDYMKPQDTPAENTAASAPDAAQSPANAMTPSAAKPSTTSPSAAKPAAPTVPAVKSLDPDQLVLESDAFTVTLNQNQSAIASVRLKKFNDRIGAGAQPVDVLDSPLIVQGIIGDQAANQSPNGTLIQTGVFSAARVNNTVTMSRKDGPWLVEQSFEQKTDSYNLGTSVRFTNTSAQPQSLRGGVLLSQTISTLEAGSSSILPGSPTEKPRIVANVKDSDQFIFTDKFCEDSGAKELNVNNQEVRYVGYDRHYFMAAFIPENTKTNLKSWVGGAQAPAKDLCPVTMFIHQDFGMVSAGASVSMSLDGYLGPKISDDLKKRSLYLVDTLDRGWFDVLAEPLLLAIKGFESALKNYGLAIILLTVLLKVLFYPLTKKAASSAHKMKKFNPEMQRLRERYKDDPRTQQQEVMRFMAAHKLNPMQGCLPILPQIPVFLAFYRVLSSAIELRQAPFFGWIQDLSVADPYYVTPLLLGVGMFLQQKLTPMAGVDKTQEKVMLAMPLIFTVMMLTLPAGMVLYMLANTVMSIAQQQWLNRKLTHEST